MAGQRSDGLTAWGRGLLCVVCCGALAGSVQAQNLLANPGINGDGAPWRKVVLRGEPYIPVLPNLGHDAPGLLHIALAANGQEGAWQQDTTCEAGAWHDLNFWLRSEPGGVLVAVGMEFTQGARTLASYRRLVRNADNKWHEVSVSFQAPAGATGLRLSVGAGVEDDPPQTVFMDDFNLEVRRAAMVAPVLVSPADQLIVPGLSAVSVMLKQSNDHAAPGTYRLSLSQDDREVQAVSAPLTPAAVLEVPTKGLASGQVAVLQVDAVQGGKTTYTYRTPLVVRDKLPKVSATRGGELRVDGKPFFTLGVYANDPADFPAIAAAGFNTVVATWQPDIENAKRYLDAAQAAGMRAIMQAGTLHDKFGDIQAIGARVQAMANHPALLCWYLLDEPNPRNTSVETIETTRDAVRLLDPDHPSLLVHWRPEALSYYRRATNIVAVDYYGPPAKLAKATLDAAVAGGDPVWSVLGSFPWMTLPGWPGPPPAAHLSASFGTALTAGTKGLLFFTWRQGNPPDWFQLEKSPLWPTVQELLRAAGSVNEALAGGTVEMLNSGDPNVTASLIRGGGHTLLVGANMAEKTDARPRLTLPGLRGTGRSLLGGPNLTINGAATLDLPPWGAFFYRLD